MIPQAYITEWSSQVPWRTNEQVEQDLIISRVLVEIFSDKFLADRLAFRGGTALHKLYLEPQPRYSEDIDLVQITNEPFGPVIDALRERLSFLGIPARKQKENNNTLIFKFYMHISYEEQGIQLQQRLDDPTKYWKHNPGDWEERQHWDKYMEAYGFAINESHTPWHICPVDNRWYRDYFVSKTIVEALEKLDMKLPMPNKENGQ